MYKLITPPTGEQITIVQARSHLRLDACGSPEEHPDDDWLNDIGIPGARDYCEQWMQRAMCPQVIEFALDAFPGGCYLYRHHHSRSGPEIELPLAPVLSVVSVTYIDANSVAQTMDASDYVLDDYQEPSWLLPAAGTSWPATASVINAVKIRLECGYTLPTDSPDDRPMPPSIRAALLLMLGHLYENREATTGLKLDDLPTGIQSLMRKNCLRLSMA